MGAQCLAQTLPKCGDLAHLSRKGSGIHDRRGSGRLLRHHGRRSRAPVVPPAVAARRGRARIDLAMLPLVFVLELMLLGAFTGCFAGLLGLGGGMLLVPFLTFMFGHQHFPASLVVHMAIATSLTTIVFTAASSVRAHHSRGSVQWGIVRWLGVGALVGTFLGAHVASHLHSGWLAVFFGCFVSLSALRMFHGAKPDSAQAAQQRVPAGPVVLAVGGGIGALSSLLGAGGGFITIPFLRWRGVPMRNAVGTSAATGLLIAIGGLLGYVTAGLGAQGLPPYSMGYIYIPALLACSVTSVISAPFGARLSHRLPGHLLQRVFSLVLLTLATYMLYTGVRQMGWLAGVHA